MFIEGNTTLSHVAEMINVLATLTLDFNSPLGKAGETGLLCVVCPNFGHTALTLLFRKYICLQVKKQKLLDCFSFRMVMYYFCSMPTESRKCVNLDDGS